MTVNSTAENGVDIPVQNGVDIPVQNGAPVENGAPTSGDGQVPLEVALSPCDLDAVPGLLKEISSFGGVVARDDRQARLKLLANARSLVQALETPRETMIKHCWGQPGAFSAMTVCVDIGLFHEMAKKNGSPKRVTELAATLKVDPLLLGRMMRHLSTMGYIVETDRDEYKPTNFSKSLTIPIIGDGYPCISGACMASLAQFSQYLSKTGYNTPNDVQKGPYQYAYNTDLNFFQYMMANQPLGLQFNHHMGGYRQGRPSWMDTNFYPVRELLCEGADTSVDAALLVDIGGNVGHDIDEFRRKHPEAPGRLILQDLPLVIGQIKELNEKIERMSYDFLTEQPVKGARAYYMHSVLHDWPDSMCLQILANITAAMKPGYSKLLINENVIPDRQADWQATALDMMMMTLLSSCERTSQQWYGLLEKAGLKILKVWTAENGVESLIECELA